MRRRFGTDKFIYELEGLFLNSKWLRNRFYLPWLGLTEGDKERFMKDVRQLVYKYLLNDEFKKALASDVIKKGENGLTIETETETYKYLKKKIYNYDARKMLMELVEVEKKV